MSDHSPKSSLEIAMERLRKKDADAGLAPVALSDAQKAEIAEVRGTYQAKLAYAELMHKSALAGQFDPAARERLDEEYQRDRARFVNERETKIERIRAGAV